MIYNANLKMEDCVMDFVIHIKKDAVAKAVFEKNKGLVNVELKKPMSAGTNEQNRAMHALLMAYYMTGKHSAPDGMTFEEFRVYMKLIAGPCFQMVIRGKETTIPKSWSDYSKAERCDFIDYLISEIHQSGAFNESEKLREIIKGMEDNSLFR